MKLTYSGGAASVVLPDRELSVSPGDVIDVTEDEAARLGELPGWRPVKELPPGNTPTTQENAAHGIHTR